jgi:DNA-binding transcriptional LysR family regulator
MENTTLKIGATLSIADYYLPKLLSSYLSTHKQPVSLTVGNTKRLTDLMLEGRIMCAFIEGNFDTSLFESRLMCRAQFLPVVSSHHRLAHAQTSFAELLDYPLLIREPGSGTRAILENHLFTNSRSLHDFPSIQEIGNFKTIKQILSSSEAISFMYEKVAASEVAAGELAFLSCRDFHVDRNMNFIYPRESLMGAAYEQFFYELLLTNTH